MGRQQLLWYVEESVESAHPEAFDPKKFKDDYELALRKLVKRKAAGEKIEALPPAEDTGKVINLMEALRRSVQSGHVPGGRANRSSKKPARRSGHRRRKVA